MGIDWRGPHADLADADSPDRVIIIIPQRTLGPATAYRPRDAADANAGTRPSCRPRKKLTQPAPATFLKPEPDSGPASGGVIREIATIGDGHGRQSAHIDLNTEVAKGTMFEILFLGALRIPCPGGWLKSLPQRLGQL
jgi:hypothetical protein